MGTSTAKALMIGALLVLVGCTNTPPASTDPLRRVIVQETVLPIGACPTQVNDVVYPTRPALAIDELSADDKNDYTKVGQAYMKTIADLQNYAVQLEDVAYGIKDICNSVNSNNTGK